MRTITITGKQLAKVACFIAGALLTIAPCSRPVFAAPSTFSTTIGTALLCLDQIDPLYFWSYLNQFFGPPYKKEGGAYWFKTSTTLWGTSVSDVLVSDGSGKVIFLAATFAEASPGELSNAISGSTGLKYTALNTTPYSPLISGMGSNIVYFGQTSKVFCAKYNPLYYQQGLLDY